MERKVRDYSFDVKSVSDEGVFEGYASVFDVIDSYRERVAPGAFVESLTRWNEKGSLPPVLWQHRSDQPLGPTLDLHEDARGLFIRAQLLVSDVRQAREAHALMKAKAITGLSIGFMVKADSFDHDEELLTLTEVDLWETSVVTFPANEAAGISTVKAAFGGAMPTLREFENFLREHGFSRSQAEAIATRGVVRAQRDADVRDESDGSVKSLLADIRAGNPISISEIFR